MRPVLLTFLFLMSSALWVYAQHDPRLNPDVNKKRPIPASDEVFMENMTWMEVRDALRNGKTTAIIATGGLEMNGPYLVTGKHNIICEVLSERIARSMGDALVATVVPFVPEGDLVKVDGHLRYPGTIGVSSGTFQALLTDIATSLKLTGFKNIILIGDSGGNANDMEAVANKLSEKWGKETGIYHVPEFYENKGLKEWLKMKGIEEVSEGIHDSFRYTAMMMLADPEYVRAKARMGEGLFSINGVELTPLEKTIELAGELADFQVANTVKAIRVRMGK